MRLLRHPMLRSHGPKFLKFAVVGSIGAIVDIGGLRLLVVNAGMSPYTAPMLSVIASTAVVFTLNKFFTFRSSGKAGCELMRFAVVYGIAIVSNAGITAFLIWAGVQYLIAKCLAIGVGILWNYGMSHAFVFKKADKELIEGAAVV
jgi:putative flippase GtrA